MQKHTCRDVFSFSKREKEFYKEKCGTVKKMKSVKNVIIKKVSYESFSSMYKYSIRYLFFELSINIRISTALLLLLYCTALHSKA